MYNDHRCFTTFIKWKNVSIGHGCPHFQLTLTAECLWNQKGNIEQKPNAGHKNIHTYDHGENLMLQSPRKPKKTSDLEQVTDKLSMLLVLNTP